MKKANDKAPIFIDGALLVRGNMSGVGRVAKHTVECLFRSKDFTEKYKLVVFVPFGLKRRLVSEYPYLAEEGRTFPLPYKVMELLSRIHLLPPVDLFLGKGVYIFFNFRNLPLAYSKSITYIHDVSFIDVPQFSHPKNARYLAKHLRRWAYRSTRLVTISLFSRTRISKVLGIPEEKIDVIYCGYDKMLVGPFKQQQEDSVREKFGLPKDYLLYVGNIEPRKNIKNLLVTYRQLIQGREVVTPLVLVGSDGWKNEEIHQILSTISSEKVIMLSNSVTDSELAIIMSRAKGLIAPSYYEGFSLPPLEAYVRGAPIAISDIPVHRELYDGEALFFDPSSLSSISEALKKLDSGMGMKPEPDSGLKDFTWERAAMKLYNVIERLQK